MARRHEEPSTSDPGSNELEEDDDGTSSSSSSEMDPEVIVKHRSSRRSKSVTEEKISETTENVNTEDGRSDELKSAWIFDRISGLKESEIDIYQAGNIRFTKLTAKIKEIRNEIEPDKYQLMAERMTALMETKLATDVFSNFGGICEFIIHLHSVYNVPLNATTNAKKDRLLVETMKSCFRKFMYHFENM